ncbi:MAG: class I SAM-dependent methyltransferase [Promethearchaeota archaeon]
MRNLLRILWHKIRFNQKEEWDKIAYKFLNECKQILDVGCGEGRFISLNPSKIIGIDWNEDSVNKNKELGYNIIKGDIRNLPFKDKSISGIHCSHVIEHFLPLDVHKILTEFNRVLIRKGILVIRTPLLYYGFYSDLTHIKPYNPNVIVKYLSPSNQRTLKHISDDFEVIYLRYRYASINTRIRYLDMIFNLLNRWGFPWIKKTGYLLVMRKNGK